MINQYKILVKDREYTDYELYNAHSLRKSENTIENPIKNKLFSNDVFSFMDNEIDIIHSSTRCMPIIPGVLILNNNQSFGYYKQKKLYKCIPDDKRLPIFLIPYTIKQLGFNKNLENKFITFKFYNWDFKHPYGQLVNILGEVSKLEIFYEYQLYCKSLYASIQEFTKETTKILKIKTREKIINDIIKNNNFEDRTNYNVFSIDLKSTTDFDDALSIQKISEKHFILSIYIANVPVWMNELELWNSFSERISSIYLPDKKRPMLPTILSECLCSLVKNEIRFAFTLDIEIKNEEIIDHKFKNTYVKIYENHEYENKNLLKDINYIQILELVKILSKKYKYINNVKNSHDVITYLMILMNYYSAKNMIFYKNGIYRSFKISTNVLIPNNLPENIGSFLKIYNSSSSNYSLYDGKESHDMLELESYIHITSPIRRLVDLINIYKIQINLNMISNTTNNIEFYNKWVSKLDYINTTMRSIRKIQNDCNLLTMCIRDIKLTEHKYEGYLFDKIIREDKLYQYMVYIPTLNTLSRITCNEDKKNYSKESFKIYLFHEESTLKKKVRLQII